MEGTLQIPRITIIIIIYVPLPLLVLVGVVAPSMLPLIPGLPPDEASPSALVPSVTTPFRVADLGPLNTLIWGEESVAKSLC